MLPTVAAFLRNSLGLDDPMDDPGQPGAVPPAPYSPYQDGYDTPSYPLNAAPTPVAAPPPPAPAAAPPPTLTYNDPTMPEVYNGGGVSPGGSGTPDAAYATPARVAQPTPVPAPLGPAYSPPSQDEAEQDARRALDASPRIVQPAPRSRMEAASQREQAAVGRPDPWQASRAATGGAIQAGVQAIPQAAGEAFQAGIKAGTPDLSDPIRAAAEGVNLAAAFASPVPAQNPVVRHAIKIYQAAVEAFGDRVGREVWRGMGGTDEQLFEVLGVPVTEGDVAGFVGGMAVDPTTYAGGGAARKPVARVAGRVLERGRGLVDDAGEMAGRVGRDLLEEGGRQILDLTPMPKMVPSGGGSSRPQLTVEVLRARIDKIRTALDGARADGDADLADELREMLSRHEGDLVDALNARRDLEPRIASDVGRRIEQVPRDARALDVNAPERVPVADVPTARDDVPRGMPSPNAILPFDPASAAAGAAAGAATEDDEGNAGDPLKAGAGLFLGAVGGTPQGRRLARRLAVKAAHQVQQPVAPPNLLEIMQGIRFSWGMLGNFTTGLINVGGLPIEGGLGLASETVRLGLLHGRPLLVTYQAAEMAKAITEAGRRAAGTAIGDLPASVRNAPDFRPPMNERMPGPIGTAVGHAIEAPGRLTSQVPDAFGRPILEAQGRAQAAADILNERGISRFDLTEQHREMQRLLNNPTADEAARIAEQAKAWADEMQYKGDPGYVESIINTAMRGAASRVATSNDPLAKQVHEALGSFIMPFFGTIWKLHKLGASRVPLLGFATNRSLPLDQKISRQIVGAGLGIFIADYAAKGMVTGPGPSDPDEAALINKDMPPRHTYVPGVGWVPNDWFGSAGPYLNAIGGYYDAQRYATEKEKASTEEMGWRTAKDVMRGMERFPVVQAFQTIYALAENPKKGLSDFLAGAGSSFVPAPLKTGLAASDPKMRTTDRDAGFLGQLQQKSALRTGIGRQDLPVQQDRFGREVENPRQGIAGFGLNVKQPENDPITRAFREAGVEPGFPKMEFVPKGPPGTRGIPAIPLTPQEQRDWNAARGRKLIEWVQPKLDDPTFRALPREQQKAQLELYLKAAGEYADGAIQAQIGGPEVTRRIREVQGQKRAS